MKHIGYIQMEENRSIVLTDLLFDSSNAICYIQFIASKKMAKKFLDLLSSSVSPNPKEKKGRGKKSKITIPKDMAEIIFDLSVVKSSKSEYPLVFNMEDYRDEIEVFYDDFCLVSIYSADTFDSEIKAFAQGTDELDLKRAFKRWIDFLPLPIPNDKRLYLYLYQHLIAKKLCVPRISLANDLCALLFSEKLIANDYQEIRLLVEGFYRKNSYGSAE